MKKTLLNKFLKLVCLTSLFLPASSSALDQDSRQLAMDIIDSYLEDNGAPGFLLTRVKNVYGGEKGEVLYSRECPNIIGTKLFTATNAKKMLVSGNLQNASSFYVNAIANIETYDVVYLTTHESIKSAEISFKKNEKKIISHFKCK